MDNFRLVGAHVAGRIKVRTVRGGLTVAECNILDLATGRITANGKVYHYLGTQSMSAIEKHRDFINVLRDFPVDGPLSYSVDQ